MNGTTVCRMHGGAAPQVRRAAQVRLLLAADQVMGELLTIALDKKVAVATRLTAIKDVLDRAGLNSKQEISVETTVKPWQDLAERAIQTEIVYESDVDEAEVIARVLGTPKALTAFQQDLYQQDEDARDEVMERLETKRAKARRAGNAMPKEPDEYATWEKRTLRDQAARGRAPETPPKRRRRKL